MKYDLSLVSISNFVIDVDLLLRFGDAGAVGGRSTFLRLFADKTRLESQGFNLYMREDHRFTSSL